jgi:hypothetical protein
MENVTTFFTHGFALHITWNGSIGIDQRGGKWFKEDGWAIHEGGVYRFKLTNQ